MDWFTILLPYAQDLGFFAWAFVVFFFGKGIVREVQTLANDISDLNVKLSDYILATEKRVTRLETLIERINENGRSNH